MKRNDPTIRERAADPHSTSGQAGDTDTRHQSGEEARKSEVLSGSLLAVPNYEVIRELGHGGMGVVYQARNISLNRFEALKVPNRDLMTVPGTKARFLHEIQLAAKLHDKHVVRVYAATEADGLLVCAMEYIDGQNLGKIVADRGPLPVRDASYYALHAARGLAHAYGLPEKIIHRDIKPSNLMLTMVNGKQCVKILDFGLAKATQEGADPRRTRTGAFMGTLPYASPEQIEDAASVDCRADLYSLGCTLFFMLMAHEPFQGTFADVMQHHLSSPPPVLHELRKDIPLELSKIVQKLMAKKPQDRYQSPGDAVRALESFFREFSKGDSKEAPKLPADTDPETQYDEGLRDPLPISKAGRPGAGSSMSNPRVNSSQPMVELVPVSPTQAKTVPPQHRSSAANRGPQRARRAGEAAVQPFSPAFQADPVPGPKSNRGLLVGCAFLVMLALSAGVIVGVLQTSEGRKWLNSTMTTLGWSRTETASVDTPEPKPAPVPDVKPPEPRPEEKKIDEKPPEKKPDPPKPVKIEEPKKPDPPLPPPVKPPEKKPEPKPEPKPLITPGRYTTVPACKATGNSTAWDLSTKGDVILTAAGELRLDRAETVLMTKSKTYDRGSITVKFSGTKGTEAYIGLGSESLATLVMPVRDDGEQLRLGRFLTNGSTVESTSTGKRVYVNYGKTTTVSFSIPSAKRCRIVIDGQETTNHNIDEDVTIAPGRFCVRLEKGMLTIESITVTGP